MNPTTTGPAIVEVFVCLVNFWVYAVQWLHQNPIEIVAREATQKLDKKFESTIDKIEKATDHLLKIVDLEQQDVRRAEEQARHAELIRALRLSEEHVDFPLKILPYPAYQGFFGRQAVLEQLRSHLAPSGHDAELKSLVLSGLGGVGKTQTALAFAHSSVPEFDAVFWIHSDTQTALVQSFSNIAARLKLPGARIDGNGKQNLLLFHGWLSKQAARPDGRKWLLIYDNCNSLKDLSSDYLPTVGGGSILITSRSQRMRLPDSKRVELKPFPIDEGYKLFRQLLDTSRFKDVSEAEDKALHSLLDKVDGLPLGIQQLASLINFRETSAVKFLHFYERCSRRIWTDAPIADDYDGDRDRNVGQQHILDHVWSASIESLSKEAAFVLGLIAFFAPDAIPIEIFGIDDTQGFEVISLDENDVRLDEVSLDRAIADLRSVSLISQEDDNITVHRLVQEAVVFSQTPERLRAVFGAAIELLAKRFPAFAPSVPLHDRWDQCRKYLQHCLSIVRAYESYKISLEPQASATFAELLNSCAWYQFEKTEHRTCLQLGRTGLKACKAERNESYARLCNTISHVYYEWNDMVPCRKYATESVQIREQLLLDNAVAETTLGHSYMNLMLIEMAEGNIDKAVELLKQAEVLFLKLGEKMPMALWDLNMARALYWTGDYAKAAHHYKMSGLSFEAILGPDSIYVASIEYGYGNIELKQQNFAQAQAHYETAKAVLLRTTPYHLRIVSCDFKLGFAQFGLGQSKSALESLHRALTLAEFVGANGEKARITRKQAQILAVEGECYDRTRSNELMLAADVIRVKLPGQRPEALDDTDEAWDGLVPGYYR